MRKIWVVVTVTMCVGPGIAEEPSRLADSNDILQRIRSKVAEHLAQLPNYTCHEKINRLVRPLNSSGFGIQDQVVVEVAFVGGQELFARPGESTFQEQSIAKVVPTGTIASGAFGSHLKSIFLGEGASFEYVGISKQNGHKSHRFDFHMPVDKSLFLVRHNAAQGIVAYQGSFWADIETLDLVRLEIKTEDIPRSIGVRVVKESVEYANIRIRDSDFLLPVKARLFASDSGGILSTNELTLEQCREYSGESTVRFGAPVEAPSSSDQ